MPTAPLRSTALQTDTDNAPVTLTNLFFPVQSLWYSLLPALVRFCSTQAVRLRNSDAQTENACLAATVATTKTTAEITLTKRIAVRKN